MRVEVFVTGPFQVNTYLLCRGGSTRAVIIDPGDDAEDLIESIEHRHLQLGAILLTHAHLDHVGAVQALRNWSNAPVILSTKERQVLQWLPESYSFFGLPTRPVPVVDFWVNSKRSELTKDFPELDLGELSVVAHETPGHSPGGVCYSVGNQWFVGDTLFKGSVGRVDLPGGSWPVLEDSLRYLSKLSDDVTIWPGHGPQTTIGQEKLTNPFMINLD